jgi:predicted P-loop ATPase
MGGFSAARRINDRRVHHARQRHHAVYRQQRPRQTSSLLSNRRHKRLEAKDKKVKGGPALAKMMGEHGKAIVKRINEWLGRDSDFIRNSDGIIIRDHQENIVRALALLNVELNYNEFSDKLLDQRTQPLEDRQLNELWFVSTKNFASDRRLDFFEKVVKRIAWSNSFHPVREYFATLQWDGTPRINDWLTKAGGATPTPYVQAVSAIVLIAAVRRVKVPGCKYDEMLVLESQQGLQKSSALRALCPNPDWFTDDFQLNVGAQRMIEID